MSRKQRKTFIELCLEGSALMEDVDEFVSRWHESEDIESELHEYLGMTAEEYSLWLLEPDILPHIIRARRAKQPFRKAIADISHMPIAARSDHTDKVKRIERWLRQLDKSD